jgi:hypothetical protein
MDTQWKQVKIITLGSVKTLEELTISMKDLRYVEVILSQTVSTKLESVMIKDGYYEYLYRYGVPMSLLSRISLLGYQYYLDLHTHLLKVATTYS